jgi:exonuclease VII large subunit
LSHFVICETPPVLAKVETARNNLAWPAAALDAMSPLKFWSAGYAIAQDTSGAIVRDAAAVSAGDELRLRLWKARWIVA